jgi:hypothetical protein
MIYTRLTCSIQGVCTELVQMQPDPRDETMSLFMYVAPSSFPSDKTLLQGHPVLRYSVEFLKFGPNGFDFNM